MKRIVGVLTVLGGQVVGSYGFSTWLPVGRIHHQIEELERWQVDEIALLGISRGCENADLEMVLDGLREASPLTPILVGGGISSMEDAARVFNGGADRVLLGSAAFRDRTLLEGVSSVYGDQAVVLSVPITRLDGPRWLEPKSGESRPLADLERAIPEEWGGELLVMDVAADGGYDDFDLSLLDNVADILPYTQAMVFGGFRTPEAVDEVLRRHLISAVCIGNAVHQRELFVRRLKLSLAEPTRHFVEFS